MAGKGSSKSNSVVSEDPVGSLLKASHCSFAITRKVKRQPSVTPILATLSRVNFLIFVAFAILLTAENIAHEDRITIAAGA